MAKAEPPFEPPAWFDDPIARKTEWTPMVRGGSGIRTHKLVAVSSSRMQFKATLGALAAGGLVAAMGIGVLGMVVAGFVEGKGSWIIGAFLTVFGVFFGGAGLWMLHLWLKPVVFDVRAGIFRRGRRDPELKAPADDDDSAVALDRIHAMQIILVYCPSSKGTFISYELNLVLEDGRRLRVVDHGKADKLLADAQKLSEFLDVPVWDATKFR